MYEVKVKVEQMGGKYGSFVCPVCSEAASYKFTAASGWCDGCDSSFIYTGGANLVDAEEGKFGTHWMALQVEEGNKSQDAK